MGFLLTPAQQQLVDITLWSLREHPEDWNLGPHRATHEKLGISIWISNGHYGLEVMGPGVRTPEGLAAFTGWLQPWRRRVLREARALSTRWSDKAARQLAETTRRIYPDARDGASA